MEHDNLRHDYGNLRLAHGKKYGIIHRVHGKEYGECNDTNGRLFHDLSEEHDHRSSDHS
jgi:hypothetical protein